MHNQDRIIVDPGPADGMAMEGIESPGFELKIPGE
jgi:hypothetical protein